MAVSFAIGHTTGDPWPDNTTAFVKASELVTQLSAIGKSICKVTTVHDSLVPKTVLVIWPKCINRKHRKYREGEAKENKFLYMLLQGIMESLVPPLLFREWKTEPAQGDLSQPGKPSRAP